MSSEEKVPLKQLLIGSFKYYCEQDILIPIEIEEIRDRYVLSLPGTAKPGWEFALAIREINLPVDTEFKIYEDPNSRDSFWTSSILRKEYRNKSIVFKISEPEYVAGKDKRVEARYFVLSPAVCQIGEADPPQVRKATCLDVSNSGIGLKIPGLLKFEENVIFKVKLTGPYQELPEIEARLVRQNHNILDNMTVLGLKVEDSSLASMKEVVEAINEKNRQDAFRLSTRLRAGRQRTQNGNIFNLFN